MSAATARRAAKAPVILHSTQGRLGSYAADLEPFALRRLAAVAVLAGLDAGHELSLVLCDNPSIRQINRRWRAMDKPTDVLSFPLHTLKPGAIPPAGPVGDIVISLPYTRAAARSLGLEVEAHLAHLLAHGLLHLLGHDHATDAQERAMQRAEQRLLAGEALR